MAKKKYINLLPQEEFESSTLGRVLHWAMGTFRIIVIVTEMIVMAAFLSRFWLDAQNSSLSDSIKIATSQIQVQSEFEKNFRQTQSKLAIFKALTTGARGSDRAEFIALKNPNGIVLTSVNIKESSAIVKGAADGESNVVQLISNLKNEKDTIKSVDLDSLYSSEEDKKHLFFTLNLTY